MASAGPGTRGSTPSTISRSSREVSDVGDGRLLLRIRTVGTGTASGAAVDQHGFTLYTFRRGKVVRQEFFADRESAEQAAGLV